MFRTKEVYPEKTLILDFRPEYEGDTFYQKTPKLSVWHDYNDSRYAKDAQHGTSTVLYSDMPGARLWWFVEDHGKQIENSKPLVLI